MHIERLSARSFRNLAPLAIDLDERAVVFRGANAQGKTNLLEALYVCATGRSFRAASPAELITHGALRGSLESRVQRHGVRHDVEVELTPRRRAMRVDGRALQQTSTLLQLVNVVAFFPDDLRIAKGSPEERRRFLDRAVGNYRPDFVDASQAYAKALRARNALLRAREAPSELMLSVYDEQLSTLGARIHSARLAALAELAPAAQERFTLIMGGQATLALSLHGGLAEEVSEGDYAAAHAANLASSRAKDRARGSTSYGPHRADLVATLEGRDVRAFASQGQQRALVLSLKLAEVHTLAARLSTSPILLLDDVSSELDQERTALLFATVRALGCQVLVSTTGAAPLPLEHAQVFEVVGGTVTRAA